MKSFLAIIFVFVSTFLFAQETPIDSAQYKIGHTIGENIPVAILMFFAILFIYKSYRNKNSESPKTDFMDDGTV